MDLNKKLLKSAQNGDLESVTESINNGADIETIDIENYDYTPLMWAVENEHLEIVRFFWHKTAQMSMSKIYMAICH